MLDQILFRADGIKVILVHIHKKVLWIDARFKEIRQLNVFIWSEAYSQWHTLTQLCKRLKTQDMN